MNTAIAITAIIATTLIASSIITAVRDVVRERHQPSPQYPRQDGEFTVLGPEIFTDQTGDVISWKGANYVRQDTKEKRA
ncbi:hypothetical protein OG342_04745 [Streptomyces bobili]|uniref:hypothetical protein n=1 Tax=Streptomyces bobili TaxID=67280 RepID=UPI002259D487|nr:hypothetical protein [Streptomyces bobili]MCX5522176.1 hypothetical protein [Streptomyces bobili]